MNEGKNLWAMANSVFDYLPFAATIDDVIFCVHGGIPRPLSAEETALESINKIPCPTAVRVTTTDARSKQIKQLSSDLLWSDPAQHEQEKENVVQERFAMVIRPFKTSWIQMECLTLFGLMNRPRRELI